MARSRVAQSASYLFDAWRVRPTSRKVLWSLSVSLALLGLGMLAYGPLTDLVAGGTQKQLAADFASPEFKARFSGRSISAGDAVTKITIPRIDVDALVVEGTDASALRAGAGHYRGTALPCEPGNVAIAGHRNIYGSPFLRLDELRAGDEIELVTPLRTCRYHVVEGAGTNRPRPGAAGWITEPGDGAVIQPLSGSWLTLTTCHPKRAATRRLIVRAVLVPA